jgi:hypothetical protein
MFKNYTVGSFKVEIAFWVLGLVTLSKFAAAGTILQMAGVTDLPLLFNLNDGFVLFLSMIGTFRLMYATTNYFDITPKVKESDGK